MASEPVGLENGAITQVQLNSSTTLSSITPASQSRLNGPYTWCSALGDPNSWLQVSLGKQYTLTHVAIQGTSGGSGASANVERLTVKYEKTEAGENWATYSKLVDGVSFPKVYWISIRS